MLKLYDIFISISGRGTFDEKNTEICRQKYADEFCIMVNTVRQDQALPCAISIYELMHGNMCCKIHPSICTCILNGTSKKCNVCIHLLVTLFFQFSNPFQQQRLFLFQYQRINFCFSGLVLRTVLTTSCAFSIAPVLSLFDRAFLTFVVRRSLKLLIKLSFNLLHKDKYIQYNLNDLANTFYIYIYILYDDNIRALIMQKPIRTRTTPPAESKSLVTTIASLQSSNILWRLHNRSSIEKLSL